MTTEQQSTPAKPWYLRWWAIVIAAVVLLGVIGGIMQALGIDTGPAPVATSSSPQPIATPTTEAPPEPSSTPTPPPQTSTGLTYGDATTACDKAAQEALYPSKWNGDPLIGQIVDRIENDAWFVKYSGTVKSEAGAKLDRVVECTVSGTPDAPKVDSVNVY